jgi:hypothetical protein
MKGIVKENGVVLVNGEEISFSKTVDKNRYEVGSELDVRLDFEYPSSCDNNPFCDGDETCVVCLYNNKVCFPKI